MAASRAASSAACSTSAPRQARAAVRRARASGTQARSARQRSALPRRSHGSPPHAFRRAVGLCIVNDDGSRVMVAERLDERGVYQMPQGGIDVGESPLEAALRELEEETGLPPNAVEALGESERWLCYHHPGGLTVRNCFGREIYFVGQAQRWFLLRLNVPDSQVNLGSVASPEFAGWRWAAWDEVAPGTVCFKRELYEQVIATLEPIARARGLAGRA